MSNEHEKQKDIIVYPELEGSGSTRSRPKVKVYSADATVVWMPNRAPWGKNRLKGIIVVAKHPLTTRLDDIPCSYGACNFGWDEIGLDRRLILLQRLFTELIYKDFLDVNEVEAAFSKIEDIKYYKFSTRRPSDSVY